MALKLSSPPADEPITLAEAKLQCSIDSGDWDSLLSDLIVQARQHVEEILGRSLITQTWVQKFDVFPCGRECIYLARPPVQSVSSITYYDSAGTLQTWSGSSYLLDKDSEPARIQPAPGGYWPSTQDRQNAAAVTFVAGYGDDETTVPGPIRRAMLLLISHWFENREATIAGTIIAEIPQGVDRLLRPWRVAHDERIHQWI